MFLLGSFSLAVKYSACLVFVFHLDRLDCYLFLSREKKLTNRTASYLALGPIMFGPVYRTLFLV